MRVVLCLLLLFAATNIWGNSNWQCTAFSNYYRPNHWLPFILRAPQTETAFSEAPGQIEASLEEFTFSPFSSDTLYFPVYNNFPTLTVKLRKKVVWRQKFSLQKVPSGSFLLASSEQLNLSQVSFSSLSKLLSFSFSQLPREGRAIRYIDIIWHPTPTPQETSTLTTWLRLGGVLITKQLSPSWGELTAHKQTSFGKIFSYGRGTIVVTPKYSLTPKQHQQLFTKCCQLANHLRTSPGKPQMFSCFPRAQWDSSLTNTLLGICLFFLLAAWGFYFYNKASLLHKLMIISITALGMVGGLWGVLSLYQKVSYQLMEIKLFSPNASMVLQQRIHRFTSLARGNWQKSFATLPFPWQERQFTLRATSSGWQAKGLVMKGESLLWETLVLETMLGEIHWPSFRKLSNQTESHWHNTLAWDGPFVFAHQHPLASGQTLAIYDAPKTHYFAKTALPSFWQEHYDFFRWWHQHHQQGVFGYEDSYQGKEKQWWASFAQKSFLWATPPSYSSE